MYVQNDMFLSPISNLILFFPLATVLSSDDTDSGWHNIAS